MYCDPRMRIDPVRRIGVTMREVTDASSGEPRDALAQDWSRFLDAALPDAAWCPLPNVGDRVVEYIARWGIDAIILTGGDDVGECSARDRTERALTGHCIAAGFPMLGICRGLQRLWTDLGGQLREIAGHAGSPHTVDLHSEPGASATRMTVNSYHRYALDESRVPPLLTCIARASDGSIEAVRCTAPRLLGMMWHPERNGTSNAADVALIRWLFGHD